MLLLTVADSLPADLPANAVKDWLEILFWLAAGIGAVLFVVKVGKGERPLNLKQPIHVKSVEDIATVPMLRKVEEDFRNQVVELRAYMHKAIHDMQGSQQHLLNQIKEQGEETRELFNKLDSDNERRVIALHNRINEVVDRTPEKIIGLLKTTGVIK